MRQFADLHFLRDIFNVIDRTNYARPLDPSKLRIQTGHHRAQFAWKYSF